MRTLFWAVGGANGYVSSPVAPRMKWGLTSEAADDSQDYGRTTGRGVEEGRETAKRVSVQVIGTGAVSS